MALCVVGMAYISFYNCFWWSFGRQIFSVRLLLLVKNFWGFWSVFCALSCHVYTRAKRISEQTGPALDMVTRACGRVMVLVLHLRY